MTDWPVEPVYLNHLEAMAISLALGDAIDRAGPSSPQQEAFEKVAAVLEKLLDQLGRPA